MNRSRWVAVVGVTMSLVVFFWLALAPDGGATAESILQGLAFASLFAAPPAALLMADSVPGLAVALGGGMLMAGLATNVGGNLLAPAMAAVGVLVLFLARSPLPSLNGPLVLKLAGYGILLTLATWMSFGSQPLATIIAVLVAFLVAISGRFRWLWGPS